MNHRRSIRYYRAYYRLMGTAVIIMMAVLTGSLLVGDAVRGTLVDRVQERLGETETVIASGTGFLGEEILVQPLLRDARGYLLTDGFVSHGGRMIPVMVWGCECDSLDYGQARINVPLARKLGSQTGDFVLHLPAHSLVPSGSLFVTKSYSTQLRLRTASVKTVKEGGNLLLRNEQALPLNVFMSRAELAELMGLEGKINLVLSPRKIAQEDFAAIWNASYAGLRVEQGNVVSDRIFLPRPVVDVLQPERTALAYLVNHICTPTDTVPYSFVTAVDSWEGEPLTGQEMVLSDYAAERMKVQQGDTVQMDYFVTRGMKALETQSQKFVVKLVVPLERLERDKQLQAEFPGLSNVERCADWDSDLPIDMDAIGQEDEDFWYAHHQTPKAIVAYEAVAGEWGSSFGVATAVQCQPSGAQWQRLTPQLMGVTVVQPREAGLHAAENGTDFSSLFLALGFFIILAAVLLMQNPIAGMLVQRHDELLLYETLGYTHRRVRRMLFGEIATVLLPASLVGVLAGILYAALVLFLLAGVWSGATHTEGFRLHIHAVTLIDAWLAGMAVCALTVARFYRNLAGSSEKTERPRRKTSQGRFVALSLALLFLLTLALYIYNKVWAHSIALFVVCGLLWLVASGWLLMAFIGRKARTEAPFSREAMMWKSLAAQRGQVRLSFWAIATGVFTVFAVGLNRPDFSHSEDDAILTGGFDLWCENRIAMEYDLNQPDVRRKLYLQDLPADTRFMQCLKHTADEASCLNLNKVTTPTVLGVKPEDLSRFGICLNAEWEMGNAEMGNRECEEAVPVLIDQESLTWSLMKSVGDTLHYDDQTTLVIAGTYPTGVFHGSALMADSLFRQLWPEESGSRVMLVKVGNEEVEEVENVEILETIESFEGSKSSKPSKPPKQELSQVRDLLEIALNEYGISIMTTTERLQAFFTVTDTYLTIFLTLGGLGLLLGIFSLAVVLRKTLLARRTEIRMLATLGYPAHATRLLFTRECLLVPLAAIAAGAAGSLISISANVGGAGGSTLLTALFLLIALLIIVYQSIKRLVVSRVTESRDSVSNE